MRRPPPPPRRPVVTVCASGLCQWSVCHQPRHGITQRHRSDRAPTHERVPVHAPPKNSFWTPGARPSESPTVAPALRGRPGGSRAGVRPGRIRPGRPHSIIRVVPISSRPAPSRRRAAVVPETAIGASESRLRAPRRGPVRGESVRGAWVERILFPCGKRLFVMAGERNSRDLVVVCSTSVLFIQKKCGRGWRNWSARNAHPQWPGNFLKFL